MVSSKVYMCVHACVCVYMCTCVCVHVYMCACILPYFYPCWWWTNSNVFCWMFFNGRFCLLPASNVLNTICFDSKTRDVIFNTKLMCRKKTKSVFGVNANQSVRENVFLFWSKVKPILCISVRVPFLLSDDARKPEQSCPREKEARHGKAPDEGSWGPHHKSQGRGRLREDHQKMKKTSCRTLQIDWVNLP